MGLFGKKKNAYEEASNDLNNNQLASDRIIFFQMIDSDKKVQELSDELMNGNPLVINFDNLEPSVANKILSFLAGVTYAIEGRNVKINDRTFLFARKVDFYDGSLQEFIENLPKN